MLLLRQKREGERSVNTGINHRGQSNTWVNERELLVTVMSRSSVNDEDTPVVLHTIHLSVTLISGVTDTCTTEILQVNTSFNSVWASETKHKNVRLLQLWESCRSSLWRLKRVFLLWGKLLNCLYWANEGVCYRWKMFPLSQKCVCVRCRIVRSFRCVDISSSLTICSKPLNLSAKHPCHFGAATTS